MGIKLRMSKRQEAAAAKRAAVLSSRAFQMWWAARQGISPIPSDPYRAFMIDKGLYAKPFPKEYWENRTNRADFPTVDFPFGTPRRRTKIPSRKELKRKGFILTPMPAQPQIMTAYEKKVAQELYEAQEKYHLPRATVKIQKGARASYIPAMFGTPIILLPKKLVKIGEKGGGAEEQVMAIGLHEFGHHGHAAYGGMTKARGQIVGELSEVITSQYVLGGSAEQKIKKERIAWAIAKKTRKAGKEPWTPTQAWLKKFAFGTYLGTTPRR